MSIITSTSESILEHKHGIFTFCHVSQHSCDGLFLVPGGPITYNLHFGISASISQTHSFFGPIVVEAALAAMTMAKVRRMNKPGSFTMVANGVNYCSILVVLFLCKV
jgi:hypothetical protein